jgi:TRAP-type C4-dicarboxylate transport system substrate-binding protein
MAIISTAKLYEVQKYCSITNHMGWLVPGQQEILERLPKDLQDLMARIINEAAMNQRADVRKLNDSLVDEMKGKGLAFNNADADSFRAKLRSAGFYAEEKEVR